MNLRNVFVAIVGLCMAMPVLAATYKLDSAHSELGFNLKHLMLAKVKGTFNKYEGGFSYDEKKKELKDLEVKIQATSIDTNEPKRDEHLRSADFFDVAQFSEIIFKSEKVVFQGSKKAKVTGPLTMHGVTKPVTLDVDIKGEVNDGNGNDKLVFEATGKISRKDWGLSWNKTLDKGGVAVGDEVNITIEGQALKVKEEAPKK